MTGGGTAGHVFPALAVAEELSPHARARLVWIGSRRGMERSLVADTAIPYLAIPAGKLRRYFDFKNVVDAVRVAAAVVCARVLLRQLQPTVVFSKGGYVSLPVVLAARSLGIPVLAHESDARPGLATRLAAPYVERMFVAYEETRQLFSHKIQPRVLAVGNPVRPSFVRRDRIGNAGIVPWLDDSDGLPTVLVTGGSLGARQLNQLVAFGLDQLVERARVVHQTGATGVAIGSELARRAPAGRYHHAQSYGADFPLLMRSADVVVARAGAGTIWELAATGVPSILVPLSTTASRGDQLDNAERFAQAGATIVFSDPDLHPQTVVDAVVRLLDDTQLRGRMGDAAARFAHGNAAATIAREIERYALPEADTNGG